MATYYVTTAGTSGGDGSEGSPWDIETGFDLVDEGDTLYIGGGRYFPTKTLRVHAAYIGVLPDNEWQLDTLITNIDGETPILDGTNVMWNYTAPPNDPSEADVYLQGVIGLNQGRSHVTIDGLQFENTGPGAGTTDVGMHIQGSDGVTNYTTVRNCKSTHSQGSAFIFGGGVGHIVEDCEVVDFTYQGNHEGITFMSVDDGIVRRNYVHDIGNENAHNNGIGIDFKNGGYNNKCYDNQVANCKLVGIYCDARGDTTGLEIYNNRVYNVAGNDWPTSQGIVIASEVPVDPITGTKVYNNIVTDMSSAGIILGWTSYDGINLQDTEVVNNVSVGNNYGIAIYLSDSDVVNASANNLIANNIIWDNTSASISNNGTTETDLVVANTNILDGSVTSVVQNINPISDDPLFVDATNDNYDVQNGSPAIDTGLESCYIPIDDYNNNPRPKNRVDIGAYENQEGITITGNFRLTGKAFSNNLGIMKRVLTTTELAYLNTTPEALGIIANGGTDANLPDLTQADFSNYVAFDEGVGTAHDDITLADYTLDDGAVWVEA